MAAANNEFFEALSMLEHERGITAEYLIEKIKASGACQKMSLQRDLSLQKTHVFFIQDQKASTQAEPAFCQ